jgi:hypothetical protein
MKPPIKAAEFLAQDEVVRLLTNLQTLEPGSDEYKAALAQFEKIVKLNDDIGKMNHGWFEKLVNNGPLVSGVSTLLGVITMVSFEHTHVATSKALNWLKFR